MYVDALTMAAVADELRACALGGRVQDVLALDALELGLEVYAHGRRRYIVMSAHPTLARVHLASEKLRRGQDAPSPSWLLLRKWVRGAILERVETPAFERILRLGFDHPELGTSTIIVEVMGRYSNIILVDAGNNILDSIKRIGPELNRYRVLLPHQSYVPPPPQEKLPPDQLTELRLQTILAAGAPTEPAWKALVRGLRGVSPLLAREIARRAYDDPAIRCDQIERVSPLLDAVRGLLMPLATGAWEPSVGLEGALIGEEVATGDGEQGAVGKVCDEREEDAAVDCFAPYALTHYRRWRSVSSMSEAIEIWLQGGAQSADTYRTVRAKVQSLIDAAQAVVKRRAAGLRQQLASLEDVESLRLNGELILAYAWGAAPGQSELAVVLEEGRPARKIPIDPALSPPQNAQAYFERYQKAKRSRGEVPPLLAAAELELERLAQWRLDVELAANRLELDDIRSELVEAGYIKGKASRKRAAAGGPLSFTTDDGFAILVGRNSRQNDQLTFKVAQVDDLWFHARGVAGAHVILRLAGRRASASAIHRAAELAAYYSAARQDSSVEVDYTSRRHVKRRPGGSAGQVTYRKEETVSVGPQP